MTSADLKRLNRNIEIVYRHLLGDPAIAIAERFQCTHQNVTRILQRAMKNPHIVRSAKDLKRIREADAPVHLPEPMNAEAIVKRAIKSS